MGDMVGPITIRAAAEQDLAGIYQVYYLAQGEGEARPETQPPLFADIRHECRSGVAVVAERDGRIEGFAALTIRGEVAFLSSLFVREGVRSQGLGRRLLDAVLPHDGKILATVASADPRALSLYTQAGMRPRWPILLLRGTATAAAALPVEGVRVEVADPDDPELALWDARCCGRPRPQDHTYWRREERAESLLFRRGQETIGYGIVRLGAGTLEDPGACTIGPVGALLPDDAAACVLAAVRWAADRSAVLRIDVPGPHHALAPLLAAGFRIVDQDTFCSSGLLPFVDSRCYVGSGGSLM